MKYYMVEGIILDAGKMDDAIMKEIGRASCRERVSCDV